MLLKATCSERSEREPCDVGKTKIGRGELAGDKIAKSELPHPAKPVTRSVTKPRRAHA